MNALRFPTTSTFVTLLITLLPGSGQAQHLPAPEELEAPIAAWTNVVRMQQSRPPLRLNEELNKAARLHARNMAAQEIMAHSLDGETLADRLRRVGYRHAGAGENVATS
jgi:uncharacterized protein YkwD